MNAIDRIAAAKTRRANAGLIANNGIACRNEAEVAYYNLRDTMLRDENGLIRSTDELRALKKLAGM